MVTRTIWYHRCEFIIYPPNSSTGRWRVLIWPPSRDAPRAMPFHSTEGRPSTRRWLWQTISWTSPADPQDRQEASAGSVI
jgi:hypothetical protein